MLGFIQPLAKQPRKYRKSRAFYRKAGQASR